MSKISNIVKLDLRLYIWIILIAAYIIRIIYPNQYITEVDYPGHLIASLRLSLTSPFEVTKLSANTFIQLISFSHGYTTLLLPFVLYQFFFTLIRVPFNEISLVYINNIIGILSIASIYYFTKLQFGHKVALLTALILAVLPIQIGLSRVHVGNQLVESIFFFLSLAFLYKYIQTSFKSYKFIYFLLVFFYIGSDNVFFIGLLFHILYVFFTSRKLSLEFKQLIKKIYQSFYTVVFILMPIGVYIFFDILRIKRYGADAPGGFLSRTFSKSTGLEINLIKPFIWSLELLGPAIIVVLILAIVKRKKVATEPILMFFSVISIVYYLLLSLSSQLERNYIFYLAPPLVIIGSYVLSKHRLLTVVLITITFFYSLSVVYGVNIGIQTTSNYGSINKVVNNSDFGVKTLGYLVRENMLPVSTFTNKNTEVKKLGIFMDFFGGWYYTGDYYNDKVIQDISTAQYEKYKHFIVVYNKINNTEANEYLLRFVLRHKLYLIGSIKNNKELLLDIYSNIKSAYRVYNVQIYNKKFDSSYGNIRSVAKLYLGIY